MKAILLCQEYKRNKFINMSCFDINTNQNEIVQEANRLKKEFFKPEILEEICIKLITKYFLLTKEDLQLWEEDPETFGKLGSDNIFIKNHKRILYMKISHFEYK